MARAPKRLVPAKLGQRLSSAPNHQPPVNQYVTTSTVPGAGDETKGSMIALAAKATSYKELGPGA